MAENEIKLEEVESFEVKKKFSIPFFAEVYAIKDFNSSSIEDLNIKKGEVIKIKAKDGSGWAEGENNDGMSGWFPLECVENVESDTDDNENNTNNNTNALDLLVEQAKGRNPRVNLLQSQDRTLKKKRDSLQNLLSSRPLKEDLVKKAILPSNETVDQVQAAQKRLLKQQKKKKKADKNNIAHKILTGIPLEITPHFKLSEHDFDNVVISLLQIPLSKLKSGFTSYEDVFSGSTIVQLLQNDFMANILKVPSVTADHAKLFCQDLFQRHVLICVDSSSKTFKTKNLYQLSISQTDYSSINLDKVWISDDAVNGYELSITLAQKMIDIMKRFLPDFNALRKSSDLRRFSLELAALQKVNLKNTSEEQQLIFFINLFNMMVLFCHSKFIPPTNPLDRRYLYEHCSIITNFKNYSLQDINNEINTLAKKNAFVQFCLSDCTKSTPATFVFTTQNFSDLSLYAARHFLDNSISLLESDYELHLPKMCQSLLSSCFGNDKQALLKFVIPLLAEQYRIDIGKMQSVGSVEIKFKNYSYDPSYVFEEKS